MSDSKIGLKGQIDSTVAVSNPNRLDFKLYGIYNTDESGYAELMCAKLELLVHHIKLMQADLACSNENRVVFGDDTMAIAEKLYARYEEAIKTGIDVFDTDGYYHEKVNPMANKIQAVREVLDDWLSCCECAVEACYLKSLSYMLTMCDFTGYRKLHAELDSYEDDYHRLLYWKRDTKI